MDLWTITALIYIAVAAISFAPVLIAILKRVRLPSGGPSFEESGMFAEPERKRLSQHYERLQGTLIFWKNQALKYKRFHYYTLIWTIPSSVLIPIITQFVSADNGSRYLLTVISTYTAILLAFHKALKVEENFKAFRHGESEFYDTYRRLLDRPGVFGDTSEEQIESYFKEVELIRRFVRNAETNNLPTMEQARQKYEVDAERETDSQSNDSETK